MLMGCVCRWPQHETYQGAAFRPVRCSDMLYGLAHLSVVMPCVQGRMTLSQVTAGDLLTWSSALVLL